MRSECLRLHVWKECSRRVYFMKFGQGHINVLKKAEEKRGRRERKKEKNCELDVFGRTSNFNILVDRTLWDFNIRI